jgi:hypothetical protein
VSKGTDRAAVISTSYPFRRAIVVIETWSVLVGWQSPRGVCFRRGGGKQPVRERNLKTVTCILSSQRTSSSESDCAGHGLKTSH